MKNSTDPNDNPSQRRPPARTPEARENQLVAMAYDLVEQRIRKGTATSQEVTHFLKLGSTKERMEKEMLAQEIKLKQAKTEAIQSAKRMEELYDNAIKAMRTYGGGKSDED